MLIYRTNLRVIEIAQDEIDEALAAAECQGRFGEQLSERVQPRPLAAGHDKRENAG